MSQFDSRFDVMLNGKTNDGVAVTQKKTNYIPDPRPDLIEDSSLWIHFLSMAETNEDLFDTLRGFRCCGTRLILANSGPLVGAYVLRPEIDPTGDRAWMSADEYETAKKEYLEPMEAELLKLLGEFNQQVRRVG
jgi:hypothetical protein